MDGAKTRKQNTPDEALLQQIEQLFPQLVVEVGDLLGERVSKISRRSEFKTLESKVDDIQEKVTRLDTRTHEDTGAALKDIGSLRKRLSALERQVKSVQAS